MKNLIKRIGIYTLIAIVLYLLQAYVEGSFDITEFDTFMKALCSFLFFVLVMSLEIVANIKEYEKEEEDYL